MNLPVCDLIADAISPRKRKGCFDCGEISSQYMVHDEVWLQAWPTYIKDRRIHTKHFLELCFNCLEVRLDRPLTIHHFTEAPVNNGIRKGYSICLEQSE